MLRLLRRILFIPAPEIQRDKALQIAEAHFQSEEVQILDPKVIEELRSWLIWANGHIKGSPWIRIDNQTGEVVASGTPMR